ncbi:MAG: hypothetical protein JKY67_22645 [Pseudomonadales bacterium]|nr:hypothetical protein [Pseudomonadales bacterium]
MSDSLLEQTLNLLQNVKGVKSRRSISSETGLDYEWLQKLAQGKIEDPGVKKIERLFKYLSEPATKSLTAV